MEGLSLEQPSNKVSTTNTLVFPSDYYLSSRQGRRKLECWRLAAGWGWGCRRGAGSGWGSPRGRRPQTLGSLSGPSLSERLSSVHSSPLPAASPALLSPIPPPPASLLGPWIMSTGELENRTLVCFASLAPSRQHRLLATEEGAAQSQPASLPTLARLIRDAHCSSAWHHHPRFLGARHLPHSDGVGLSPDRVGRGGGRGSAPTPR